MQLVTKMRKKIAFVYQEALMSNVLRDVPVSSIGTDFYASDLWVARPNSTSRLNLVNYQAMAMLSDRYDISEICVHEINVSTARLFMQSDIIVVNTISSPRSREFVGKFFSWVEQNQPQARIVLGTELSWYGELAQQRGITEEMVRFAYFGALVLRHTPRTERELYRSTECVNASVQEFDIGLDTAHVRPSTDILKRNVISFVKAPDGRVTKNNSLIDEIISLIALSPTLADYEVQVIAPPYSSVEYWDLMDRSAFFVFTSLGETFSYCLNDAKASGAISFYPEQMYYSPIGFSFAVEAYPKSGIKYSSAQDVVSKLEFYAADSRALIKASESARRFVVDNFSVDAIAKSWDKLFSGASLNTETLLVFSSVDYPDWQDVVSECLRRGVGYAMCVDNMLVPDELGGSLSWHDTLHDLVVLKYMVTRDQAGDLRRVVTKGENGVVGGIGRPERAISKDEVAAFMQLVCRQYRIGRILISAGVREHDVSSIIGLLRVVGGIDRGLVAPEILNI